MSESIRNETGAKQVRDVPVGRILCVEDHADTCELLETVLTLEGYEVTVAGNLTDGLRLARSSSIDLILMDNRFEEGTGVELCRQIRLFDRTTPVIFLSADAYERQIKLAFEAGAQAYLTKPVDIDDLKRAIERLLNQATSQKGASL